MRLLHWQVGSSLLHHLGSQSLPNMSLAGGAGRMLHLHLFPLSILFYYHPDGASLVAQMVKRLPTMPETRVQSLDQEAPLEKEMATHSSILAWKIPWREEPGGLQSMGSQRVRHD